MAANAERVERLTRIALADDMDDVAELDRCLCDPDRDVRFWAMCGLERRKRFTPGYVAAVAELTGFGDPYSAWPEAWVAAVSVPDEPERTQLLADPAVVACFAGLVRVAGKSRQAQGLVDLCAAIVERRGAEIDGEALLEAATMPGSRQYDVDLDDSRGGQLPRVIEAPLPPLELGRLRELARAELGRRDR